MFLKLGFHNIQCYPITWPTSYSLEDDKGKVRTTAQANAEHHGGQAAHSCTHL